MKIALASAASLLVGLALGWLVFRGEPVVQNIETKQMQRVEVAVPGKTIIVEVPSKAQPVAAHVLREVGSTSAPQAALPPEQELVALRAKVTELETALRVELKLREGTEGAKVPVPAGLPARLRDEKLLVSSFNAALKEAGFPGQVSNVDCSEHPCIVFGDGFGERGDLQKLLPTAGFAPYAKDEMSSFGFLRGKDSADPASRFFGVAMLPPGAEPSEELHKRIAFRVRQMEEVSRPPDP